MGSGDNMDASLQKNFYSILGVSRDASNREIKQRFRELARDRHPDRFKGNAKQAAEDEFQNLTEAFNVLMDPVRRRQVDILLSQPKKARHDPADIMRVYMNRGIRSYKEANYLEAANNFDRATQTEPGNAQAWHHLALASMKEERWWPKSQQAITRACELKPEDVAYLKLAGRIYAMGGMTSRAKQYYNQALKLAAHDGSIKKALQELAPGATARGQDDGSKGKAGGKAGLFRKMW